MEYLYLRHFYWKHQEVLVIFIVLKNGIVKKPKKGLVIDIKIQPSLNKWSN